MKKNIKGALVATLICLLPIAVGLALYGRLPQQMPTHWNIHGQVDGYSSKAFAVFGLPLLLAGINLLVWFGLNSDPKRRNIGKAVWYIGLYTAPVISVLMSSVTYLWALGYTQIPVDSVVMALVSVVFIAVGNYLPKCRQNYTSGIKLPWTLNDEENWNKTHRMAGPLWMVCGVLMLANIFLKQEWLLLAGIFAAAFAPMVYSYLLFRKKQKGEEE